MNIYTQEELEGMSDGSINAIATHIFDRLDGTWEIDDEFITNNPHSQRNWLHYNIKSFCNSWSDCGALIDELCTSRTVLSQGKSIHGEYVGYTYGDKSLLVDQPHKRAVTIIYILTKQGES